jgi:uncharacterized protein (DUF1697 family)
LLRAVNVGGRNKLPMAGLRAALVAHGYDEVTTLLQSGNVVVRSPLSPPALEVAVSEVIRASFDLEITTLVLAGADLATMKQANTLWEPDRDPSRLVVIVLAAEPAEQGLAPLPEVLGDTVLHRGRFVFQWCPDGISNALPLTPWLEKHWSLKATARNWRTMSKLSTLVLGEP